MAKKILEIFFISIIVIILIVTIYSVVKSRISGESYTNILGYTILEVVTGSMSGTIEIGDGVIVQLTDYVEEKDIIVYEKNGQLITHRLITKEEGQLITQGDANNVQDDPITKDVVIGRVIFVIPNINFWKKAIIVIFITLIFIYVIVQQIRNKKRNTLREE